MEQELGSSWPDLLACYQEKPWRGYRLNRKKTLPMSEDFFRDSEPVAWCAKGRCSRDTEGISLGKHPLYYGGAYYIQEPSAMLPAAMLAARPGEKVLDLCAAPGGKSTQLLDDMEDRGLLVSNDISPSRGKAIVRNLERFGFRSFLVTAESPERLAQVFPGYFDRILVDAPCSGEGMFRREPDMRQEWEEKGPSYYAPIQREILSQAVAMLRPGGTMVYSTCTFSREEDEENVAWLLHTYPDLSLVEDRKLMPHEVHGEGQYAACLRKSDTLMESQPPVSEWEKAGAKKPVTGKGTGKKTVGKTIEEGGILAEFGALLDMEQLGWNLSDLSVREDQVYLLPIDMGFCRKLRFLRTGLLMGSCKKNRFEPSQALAMYLNEDTFRSCIRFPREDERVIRYLKGETIDCEGAKVTGEEGWCLVTMEGLPLGFAKRKGTLLKNKLDAGWRML